MSQNRQILGRILIGSAIGAVIGLILLAMGIVVILNALEGRKAASSGDSVEVQLEDPAPEEGSAYGWGSLNEPGDAPYDDRYQPARPDDGDDDDDDEDNDEDDGDEERRIYSSRPSDEDYGAYPQVAPAPAIAPRPRTAEPLPPPSRNQWRSIFEDDAPASRQAPPRVTDTAPPAPTPRVQAPSAPQAPAARPAPRPRAQPEAKKDEESLFY